MTDVRTELLKALNISDGGRSLSELLNCGANPCAVVVHSHSLAALHYAAEQGSAVSVRLLVSAGADVDALDKSGNSPLHYAALLPPNDGYNVAEELLSAQPGLDIFNNEGRTAVLVAARHASWGVVRLLLESGVDINQASKCNGQTVLHSVARKGCIDVARYLFRHPVNVSVQSLTCETPLHLAACNGHYAMAQLLISQGADVNRRTKAGRTPLHWAAQKGHRKLAVLLVQHSASPYQRDTMASMPINFARNSGHQELVSDITSLRDSKPWFLSYICRVRIRSAIGEDRFGRIHELQSRMSIPLRRYVLKEDSDCYAGENASISTET